MTFFQKLKLWSSSPSVKRRANERATDSDGSPLKLGSADKSNLRPPSLSYRSESKTPDLSEIRDGEIVEVVFDGRPLWIMFKCPCRQGHVISLPASKDRHPHWSIVRSGDRVSMSPSVWQRDGCFSHFVIKRGEFALCGDSGIPPWIAAPRYYKPPPNAPEKRASRE